MSGKILIKILLLSFLAYACMPTQAPRNSGKNLSGQNSTTNPSNETTATELTEAANFFQINGQKYTQSMPIFSNFQDSFILRGNQINNYFKGLSSPYAKKYCLAINFPQMNASVTNPILVLEAKVRSYVNTQINSLEYYLQMEAANTSVNAGNCLTVSLTNALNTLYSSTSLAFKLSDVCPSCTSTLNSSNVKLFNSSGATISSVDVNHLKMTLNPDLGTALTSSISCTSNASCSSQGLDCCLNGQCVNHGQVKGDVDTSSNDYAVAVAQILARPELINNYQDIFYICPIMVPTNPNQYTGDDTVDPIQAANDLVTELKGLYECLNPQLDEYAICKKEYSNASTLINGASYPFSAGNDDLNFKTLNTNIAFNNIVSIDYGGELLYRQQLLSTDTPLALSASNGTIGASNDDLPNTGSATSGQVATLSASLPSTAGHDTISIRYLVDGTCEKIGGLVAQCYKTYTLGQTSTPARPSDHDLSATFKLPKYANTSYNVAVNVSGANIPTGASTWSLVSGSVVFAASYPLVTNQTVKITYFVTSNISQLMESKATAQTKVDTYCACDTTRPCNLSPVTQTLNGVEKVINYQCYYSNPNPDTAPLQKTVYLNARSVPHKFYDQYGVYYSPEKLKSSDVQEGNTFEYEGGNPLKPNNVATYVGFNEINGSFNKSFASAMPAEVVEIKKGKRYDIFVDSGIFSSCLNCGSDYYSNLQKIFPGNFIHKGGGYLPDPVESRRRDNKGTYASDDLYYGRACFVPATMIPWTHVTNTDVTLQRNNRQNAQHFLFANGLNRDWYGFDYGSLIGSFDGVKWFSIGNQRRIEAKSNRLFLALNQYFGDMTSNNSFKIVVSETAAVLNSGTTVDHDLESDGAQCQKFHLCDTDNDCATQLGYDYACEAVNGIYTPWPQFDTDGNELSGSLSVSMLSLVGGSNGANKRCVYRGKGAPCTTGFTSVSAASSYSSSALPKLNACSANNYCAPLAGSTFNQKISRYAQTPVNQNLQTYITTKTDTIGLKARYIGRPSSFYGTESTPAGVLTQLASTNVTHLCIPGKDPSAATYSALNSTGSGQKADELYNVGRTYSSTQDTNYYNACPAYDSNGSNVTMSTGTIASNVKYSLAQNISSNLLTHSAFTDSDIFNDSSTLVTKLGHQKNACLRSPGSSCFSDLECAPNTWVASKVKSISEFMGLNEAEQNFWKEGLICGNSQSKMIPNTTYFNPIYDLTTHRCCRETSKTFTYNTQNANGDTFEVFDGTTKTLKIPGYNMSINDDKRYSRINTTFDKMGSTSITDFNASYPPLYTSIDATTASTFHFFNQFKTLDLNNRRMCCTENWVRNFASTNGGGHKFLPTTLQNFDIDTFKPLNWAENVTAASLGLPATFGITIPFACGSDELAAPTCEIKDLDPSAQTQIAQLNWFAKFELLGIPQVLIESDFRREIDESQEFIPPAPAPPPATFEEYVFKDTFNMDFASTGTNNNVAPDDYVLSNPASLVQTNRIISGSTKFYSAASISKFDTDGKKQIFSEDEFSCCIPTGVAVDASVTNSMCCTGQVYDDGTNKRCCLNDFTDLTIYTNRYVSSEGRTFAGAEIPSSAIDPYSGYIDKEFVLQMAPTMCCSGEAMVGNVITQLMIPIGDRSHGDPNYKTVRWTANQSIDGTSEANGAAQAFDAGIRWNNHVYCVPKGFSGASGTGSSASGQ